MIIFMNECIKQKKPQRPVIRCVEGDEVVEANSFKFFVDGVYIGKVVFDPPNNPVTSHEVKAWIELEPNVQVEAYDPI